MPRPVLAAILLYVFYAARRQGEIGGGSSWHDGLEKALVGGTFWHASSARVTVAMEP